MNANVKGNTIHVNLLKLANALERDPERAALMRPSSRAQLQAMAGRLRPLLKVADDTSRIPETMHLASLAEVRMRTALKQMNLAVQFQFPQLPESLTGLIRMRLGDSPRENVVRLETVLDAVRGMPGFIYPPGLTERDAQKALGDAKEAFHALATAKARSSEAAKELRVLRPEVKRMWERLGFSGWIIANVAEDEDRQAFGMRPKTRRKVAGDGEVTAVPFSTSASPPAPEVATEPPASEPGPAVNPPVVAAFPSLGQPKAPAWPPPHGADRRSGNGINGHGTGVGI